MLRLVVPIVIAIGCSGDATDHTDDDDVGGPRPDGGVVDEDGGVFDDGGTPIDASLTICDEAKSHSDFAWIETHVFTASCATVGCHTGADAEVGLRLDAGEAFANLVNKGSSTQTGWVRVVPGSTSTSYLVVALGRTAGPPPRDGFMPLGADPLCVEKLEAIERWINTL